MQPSDSPSDSLNQTQSAHDTNEPFDEYLHNEPLKQLVQQPDVMLKEYGYALIRKTPESESFSWDLSQVHELDTMCNPPQTLISGNVTQIDTSQISCFAKNFETRWTELIRSTLSKLLLPNIEDMRLIAPKFLSVVKGQGEQPIHWDSPKGYAERDNLKLSIVLYCSSGASSTAMPRFPSKVMEIDENDTHKLKLHAPLLDPKYFHSVPVFSGDIMVFYQKIPHYGVQNNSIQKRMVLFTMILLNPEDMQDSDELQYFRWVPSKRSLKASNNMRKSTGSEGLV